MNVASTRTRQDSDRELFQTNKRYQYGLWSLNVSVVVLATIVLCYSRGSRGTGLGLRGC